MSRFMLEGSNHVHAQSFVLRSFVIHSMMHELCNQNVSIA